ncbi:MAG: MBL fold metallo-hydrolase [Candidatus Moraniibacteriota bacterium]|nr:MAG: MBL fold metallo-hydrolase [Candidatus Moranbacteria bacterium]
MKILFHGAAREIGKSCIEVESRGQRYLLDAGVKFIGGGIQYPQYLEDIQGVDAVFLSHAHLDHSGALAFFEKKRLGSPIYTTKLTWQITKMLLEDTRHLEQLRRVRPTFNAQDILRVEEDIVFVDYDKEYTTKDGMVKFRYLNSGHIPGGASVLLELEGRKLLYTADFNTQHTQLMIPSKIAQECPVVDTLIVEGTYGTRNHPERALTEEAFIRSIETCMNLGGSALIPVFGVGRSQEILMILDYFVGKNPIYLDGMARKLLDHVLYAQDPYIQNKERLTRIARGIKKVYKRDRERVAQEKGVIIVSTSGMVEGGPASFYAKEFVEEKNNFILLTGYQTNGTQGRSMYDDHVFFDENDMPIPVQCHMRKFNFSAHLDKDSLHEVMRNIEHKNLILQHGDPDALDALSLFAKENLTSRVFIPQLGEIMEI